MARIGRGKMERDPILDVAAGDRWLVVVAHPDDETFGCGSLIADVARAGGQVTVVCATRGEAGERTPAIPADADLGAVRESELRAAAELLGAAQVELLAYADSGFDGDLPPGSLCAAPLEEIVATVSEIVGRVQPLVVVVLDGSDGHRDHVWLRRCVHGALDASARPGISMVETCLPNHLMRRWLVEMSDAHPGTAYHGIDPDAFGTPDGYVTDALDHSAVLELREEAIALHRSQRSPFEGLSPGLRRAFLADTHIARTRR
jgi:N-acetyl-1-D-myo-inositol-2-amino-2-deoxy-alpha-D-glucopyranoside deacetylase